MNKIVGFAPDADPTTLGVLLECENLIPAESGFKPAPSLVNAGVDPLPDEVRGALAAIDLSGVRVSIAGTEAGLYSLSGSSWLDVSGASAPFALSSGEAWSLEQFANTTVASCRSEGMLLSNGGDFVLEATAPKAKIVVAVRGFVMAFNTTDATYGDSPDRWWCSAYLDASDWTPNVATLCTTGRLVESGGEITAAERLGDDVIVYKRRSIFVGRYTGPAEVWNFIRVDSQVGCVGQNAVCDTGKAHYFLGEDDLYAFNGATAQPIGRGVLRDWYVSQRDPLYMHKAIAYWDKAAQQVWFFFVSIFGGGEIDRGLVFHPATGRWGRADREIVTMMRYASPSATYESGAEGVTTYDASQSIEYDSPFWTESQENMAAFDANGQVMTFVGTPGASSFVTGDHGDEQAYSWCDRFDMRFQAAPTTATATGYTKDDGGSRTVQYASAGIRDDAAFDMRQRGRWHRFRVDFTGDYVAHGFGPRLKIAGAR